MQLTEISCGTPLLGYTASLLLSAAIIYRVLYYTPVYYKYPLTDYLVSIKNATLHGAYYTIFSLRLLLLIVLTVLCMSIRKTDEKSFVRAQGIDIIMTLDVSGSMQAVDDVNEPIERIQAAKDHVINFIKQRPNDYIGLVIFAKHALCRCPLSPDKNMLCTIVDQLTLGVIEPDGTALAHGMLLSAQKLSHSTASSRVMIVVTDGNPSPDDIALKPVIELINQLKIKVYMIGIGNHLDRAYINYPGIGFVAQSIPLNFDLLSSIAQATGGKAFLAQNSAQIAQAYTLIDTLEKTEKNLPVFKLYKSYYKQGAYAALIIILAEWFLATFIWLGI